MKRIARLYAMAIALAAVAVPCVSAQDYYDDDLYYSPSQAAKARAEAEKALAAARAAQAAREQAAGLGAADTYTDGSAKPLAMDVDTYNRRNGTAPGGTKSTLPETGFSYTRRIERFHNPDIVSASGDTTLMDYYYETPSQQDINVYVINSIDPVGSYNPWPAYDYLSSPSWSLSWNFAPGWSFGWDSDPAGVIIRGGATPGGDRLGRTTPGGGRRGDGIHIPGIRRTIPDTGDTIAPELRARTVRHMQAVRVRNMCVPEQTAIDPATSDVLPTAVPAISVAPATAAAPAISDAPATMAFR